MLNFLSRQSANTQQQAQTSDHDLMTGWSATQGEPQPAVRKENKETDPAFQMFERVKSDKISKLEQLKAAKAKAEKVEAIATARTERMKQGIAELEQIKTQSKQVQAHLVEQEMATKKAINTNTSVEEAFMAYLDNDCCLELVMEHLNEEAQKAEAPAKPEVKVTDDVERFVNYFVELDQEESQPAGQAAAVIEERPVPQIQTPEVVEVETPQIQVKTKVCPACLGENNVDADECETCGTPFVARLSVTVPQPPKTSPAEAQFLSGFSRAETTPVED